MTDLDPIVQLEQLLQETGALPRADASRIATPAFFDAVYNFALVACALDELGDEQDEYEVNVSILRFAVFIAVRPSLLAPFEQWRRAQKKKQLALHDWPQLPRGYVTDTTVLGTLQFLSALGELNLQEKNIRLPQTTPRSFLRHLFGLVTDRDLFRSERKVLRALAELRITQTILGVA